MTEVDALDAEKQWSELGRQTSVRRILSLAACIGIDEEAFREVCAITESDAKALDILLSEFIADHPNHRDLGLSFHLRVRLARLEGWSPRRYLLDGFRHKLLQWAGRDFVIGVEVSIPGSRPWPPAIEMIAARARGETVEEISARTGYAKVTVERALATEGKDPADPNVGEHCRRLAATLYPVSRALAEMPLPCGDDCICDWRPVFRSDPPRFDPIQKDDLPSALRRRRRPAAH